MIGNKIEKLKFTYLKRLHIYITFPTGILKFRPRPHVSGYFQKTELFSTIFEKMHILK